MAGTHGVVITEATELSQLVRSEIHTMKNVTIVAGSGAMSRGRLLGQVTASLKFTAFDEDSTDGSQTPRAVLAEDVENDASNDQTALAYFAGEYRLADIGWPDGITDAEKATALQNLADRGIIIE